MKKNPNKSEPEKREKAERKRSSHASANDSSFENVMDLVMSEKAAAMKNPGKAFQQANAQTTSPPLPPPTSDSKNLNASNAAPAVPGAVRIGGTGQSEQTISANSEEDESSKANDTVVIARASLVEDLEVAPTRQIPLVIADEKVERTNSNAELTGTRRSNLFRISVLGGILLIIILLVVLIFILSGGSDDSIETPIKDAVTENRPNQNGSNQPGRGDGN